MFGNIAKGCERDKKGHFSDTPLPRESSTSATQSERYRYHNCNNI